MKHRGALPVLFLAVALAATPAAARSYSEGYVACTNSDDCITFDLASLEAAVGKATAKIALVK